MEKHDLLKDRGPVDKAALESWGCRSCEQAPREGKIFEEAAALADPVLPEGHFAEKTGHVPVYPHLF